MRRLREVPMAKPNPPRLSEHLAELITLERSGTYSNYGPEARRLEQTLATQLFGGGHCLSVCNATLGLMLVMRNFLWRRADKRKYALMPSYTFAATAHAALWNGLTPLFCDVDMRTWLPSEASEEELLHRYGDEVAVIVPCTTFGNSIDMERYSRFHHRYGVDIVVDAAAALGSRDHAGNQFGKGSRWPTVYSMHATKPFASGEGGIIYCDDANWVEELRAMASFGFEQPRIASLPGINAKMSETAALIAFLQLQHFGSVIDHRTKLKRQYRTSLPAYARQKMNGKVQAHSYEFILLPEEIAAQRNQIMQELREQGIGTGCYFSPHLAQQPYFASCSVSGSLPVSDALSHQILTLPMYDSMTQEDVRYVSNHLHGAISRCAREEVDVPTIEGAMSELPFILGHAG
jgi:dTDP-4-amino-4,6-dideoxygalactose transaminase